MSTRLGDTATSVGLIAEKYKSCQAKKSQRIKGWAGDSEQCSCQGSTEEYRCNLSKSQIAGKAEFMATEPAPPLHGEKKKTNGWGLAHLNTQDTSEEQT